MGLRDKKPGCYEVDPRIIGKADEAESWIARVIDDLVYDAYMQGRRNQAIADIYQSIRNWGKSYTEVKKAFFLLLPHNYQVSEADVESYAWNYITGFYAGRISVVRKYINKECVATTEILEADDFFKKLYHAAEDVAEDNLDQFVWDYLHREKTPSLLLREESN